MDPVANGTGDPLTALLIAPNREMAQEFSRTLPETRAFQILGELKTYPSRQTLEIRLRQLAPDVVLLDLSTDFDTAAELIRALTAFRPTVHVVGLHTRNDSEAILRSLRLGASEFLYSPFDAAVQRQAVARIRRLRKPQPAPPRELGKIVAFASAKPGSGASMLASQTAFAIRRLTSRRVLLADLDLMGGTISFYLKLDSNGSLLDVLASGEPLDAALWNPLITHSHGLDVLPAPKAPLSGTVEPSRLHDFCEHTRQAYDWVIVDLPTIFHRLSLLAFSESDRAFLVSTPELPSLHLARKAVKMLGQLGFGRERFQIVVNRMGKGDGLRGSDMQKIFDCPVHASFPNDYVSLDRMLTLGRPLDADCELGRSIDEFAGRLAGVTQGEKRRAGLLMSPRPALSET